MRKLLLTWIVLLLVFSGCRKKEAERMAADQVGGIKFGEKRFPRNGEGRKILLNDILLEGDFRSAYGEVIPFDHRLYSICLVAPEVSEAGNDPEKRVAEMLARRYLLDFQRTPEGFRADRGDWEVTVCRDYHFGPEAVTARFRSRSLAALAEKAKGTPDFQRGEKKNRAVEEIYVLEAALRAYHQDMGHYPGTLGALFQPPPLAKKWKGPYLEHFSGQDPWGRDYCYFCFPDGQQYEIFSGGEDGRSIVR